MARRSFKPGTLLAPLPAVMVSVGANEEKNIITVAWCGILSSDPPRAYISVRPSRHSHKLLKESGEFVINLTTESLALATDYSGIYTGTKVDKFEKCGLHAVESKCVSCPTIEESPLALECKVFQVIESGTHDIFMADIVNVSVREEILDENGRICYEKAGLIAYSHGEYYALGKKIGKFGYSTDKKNKARVASAASSPVSSKVRSEAGTNPNSSSVKKPRVKKNVRKNSTAKPQKSASKLGKST